MNIEEAKKIVAKKYGLGSTLVMGHREKYWHEAIEMVIKDKNRQLDEKTMAYSELGSNYARLLGKFNKTNWVSCKDLLPPFNVPVLAFCKIYGHMIASYDQIPGTDFGNWRYNDELGILPPIYWKQLVAPVI